MTVADNQLLDVFDDADFVLEAITKDELGLETLATRNSDRLDFHGIAVWKLKAALRRAYDAGRNCARRQQQEQGDQA